MATSALIGGQARGGSLIVGAIGDESGPGQAAGRWTVMEEDIWGLRQPEPLLSFAVGRRAGGAPPVAGCDLACMACCADGP